MDSKISRRDYVIIYQDNITKYYYCLSCFIEQRLRVGLEHIHGLCPCCRVHNDTFLCERNIHFDNTKHILFATRDKCIDYDKEKCSECVINRRHKYCA